MKFKTLGNRNAPAVLFFHAMGCLLYTSNASGSGQYEATTSSSHRSGDYVITTTRHYDVRRAGTTQFMGVPVDGSTKMPNGHMDAIEPYDYRAFQPFSTAYLPGYMADKYDEDADTLSLIHI